MESPHQQILGEAFESLHPHVRGAHTAPLHAEGWLDVEHGAHWLTSLVVAAMRLPAAGRRQQARLELARSGQEIEWTRTIGGTVLRTRQRADGRLLIERGPVGRVAFLLSVRNGALHYHQVWMKGAGGMTLPPAVSPRISADVSSAPAGWHVDVAVTWRTHLMCRYAGILQPR